MATIKMKDPSFSAIKRDLRGPAVLTAARRYKWCQIKTVGFIFKKTPPSSRSSLPYLPRLSSLTLVGDGGFLSAVAAAFSRIQILSLSLNPGPAFIFEWMRINEWMNGWMITSCRHFFLRASTLVDRDAVRFWRIPIHYSSGKWFLGVKHFALVPNAKVSLNSPHKLISES